MRLAFDSAISLFQAVDGDQVVQTFYTITPYLEPLDPDYSEMDYEYLPNGGWGGAALTFHVTPGKRCRSSRGTRITPAHPCMGAWQAGIHWSRRSRAERSATLSMER